MVLEVFRLVGPLNFKVWPLGSRYYIEIVSWPLLTTVVQQDPGGLPDIFTAAHVGFV